MKTRSRMHYYLADQLAATSPLPHAGAVMLSLEGHITESSTANLLMIDGDQLVSPPIESVLHGLSLRRTVRLAEQNGIRVRYENITVDAAKRSNGILLTVPPVASGAHRNWTVWISLIPQNIRSTFDCKRPGATRSAWTMQPKPSILMLRFSNIFAQSKPDALAREKREGLKRYRRVQPHRG